MMGALLESPSFSYVQELAGIRCHQSSLSVVVHLEINTQCLEQRQILKLCTEMIVEKTGPLPTVVKQMHQEVGHTNSPY